SEFVPTTFMDLDEEQEAQMLKLVDALESDDDVQEVFHNVR
ncbi:MAG TPA: YebC/PmpR family DNA-binding transcriptional regulator, partial [Deltaproteobacteria bacterium]|nr:YebC/PmpR family DNA-binding transcriptional regulator [Deltaproteobacteria bacterium]